MPDGIVVRGAGAVVGVGGGVLFSKVLTLSNSSSITELATKGREKTFKNV